MLPAFVVNETTVRAAGAGQVLNLGEQGGRVLVLTLGITRSIEQESIDISIWGSADGLDWGTRPLAAFPQKFYCGDYRVVVDLTGRPDIRLLRAKWTVNRWGKGEPEPLFAMYLFAQEMQPRIARATAAY